MTEPVTQTNSTTPKTKVYVSQHILDYLQKTADANGGIGARTYHVYRMGIHDSIHDGIQPCCLVGHLITGWETKALDIPDYPLTLESRGYPIFYVERRQYSPEHINDGMMEKEYDRRLAAGEHVPTPFRLPFAEWYRLLTDTYDVQIVPFAPVEEEPINV